MPTVWNKVTNHLSALFGEDKRSASLRPSCSLSMLNQKNLRVAPSSQSSENLHKISIKSERHATFDDLSAKKPWKKLSTSSSHFFNFRKNSSRKFSLNLLGGKMRSNMINENVSPSTSITITSGGTSRKQTPKTKTRALSEKPTSSFPLALSFSWHSNIAGTACNQQISASQQHLVSCNRNDIKYMDEIETSPYQSHQHCHDTQKYFADHQMQSNGFANSLLFRPKRSRSISAHVRDAVNVHSLHPQVVPSMSTYALNNHHSIAGFRTPQSNTNFKSKQALDAKFLALASSGLDPITEPSPIANSDFLFRRIETIGSGSYATVYKTQNRLNGLFFALKEIKLQPQEGLPFTAIREVSLLRGLKHANIIQLFQIIHQPHALILVFEYMKTDLSKFMEKYKNGLDIFRTRILLFQLLRGLAYCHDRKILHRSVVDRSKSLFLFRDLKPQNLLVSNEGELKLADFGLARAKSVPSRTFSHDVVTLWYRPPDVLLGSRWGVGCIFAELCTGHALFPGSNNVSDQLDRIFSIRGLPNESEWPEVRDLPKYKLFTFDDYTELEWDQVDFQLGELPDNGCNLLSLLLKLDPRKRIQASDAMKHCFFNILPSEVHSLSPTESIFVALKRAKSSC